MDKETRQQAVCTCQSRSAFYRFLSSVFFLELTDEQIEDLAKQDLPYDEGTIGEGYGIISEYLRHRDSGTRQELAVDYAHTFLGAGNYDTIIAPPYESVFTSEERLLMQEARDGAVAHYLSEGLSLPPDNTTPEDHVSFEMQFMATMAERSAEALECGDEAEFERTMGVQRVFFEEHLANWLPGFVEAIEKNCRTDFYLGIAKLTRGLLESEKEILAEMAELRASEVE